MNARDNEPTPNDLFLGEGSYRLLFHANPHPMWVFDVKTFQFLVVNEAAVAQYGYSEQEFLGMSVDQIRSPCDAAKLRTFVLEHASENVRHAGVWVHLRRDGSTVEAEITFQRLTFQGRDAALVLARDITDFERTRRAQESAESKFRALVEQSLVGVFMIDHANVIYANPRADQIFGYATGEAQGRPIKDFICPRDHEAVLEELRRVLSKEIAVGHMDFWGLRKDGTRVLIGAQGTLASVRGTPIVMGVFQDITEKKRLEEAERHHLHLLERAIMGTADAVGRMMEMRDPYTAGHEHRVGEIAAAIANEMHWDADRQQGLRMAGRLHDVGKIAVPSEILTKPGRLSPIEYELVKTHAQQGYEVLRDIEFPWPVAEVTRQHHERLDGSGYPRGLRGDQILMEARILAVADVVESMASHRPYRVALGIEKALEEIEKHAGRLYDPQVSAICLRLFREKAFALPQ